MSASNKTRPAKKKIANEEYDIHASDFAKYDLDGSGLLDAKEIAKLLEGIVNCMHDLDTKLSVSNSGSLSVSSASPVSHSLAFVHPLGM